MDLPRLENADVEGRTVVVRADLNVPLQDGQVGDDFRIRAFLPTLEHLVSKGCRTVVCSHLGRPKGERRPELSLAPVAERLSELLGRQVDMTTDSVGPGVAEAARDLPPGGVLVLENLRFNPGETSNDPGFAGGLASLGDLYVNDAFGASHRAHASIVGIPERIPGCAGFLLSEEIDTLSGFLNDPPRPFVVVLGGAKVADKLGVVRNLLGRADRILVGGGMCFTFLRAQGHDVGRSLVDEASLDEVSQVLAEADGRIMLPTDVVVADSAQAQDGERVGVDAIPAGSMGLDIGPGSSKRFADVVTDAASLFWNGPMGVFENLAFAMGTRALAQAVAICEGYTVTGGGDTAAALASVGLEAEVDFMSTGGGASLEFLEGRSLPGIEALMEHGKDRA